MSKFLNDIKHYFFILQTTGTTIAASAKMQINMAVKRIPAFASLENVRLSCVNHKSIL